MRGGSWGRLWHVDMTGQRVEAVSVNDSDMAAFLGGSGLGAYLLYRMAPVGQDPLAPESVLGFLPGTLTGASIPFADRFMVVGKSPASGGWGEANCGGYWGAALKRCGVDGLLVSGVSPQPCYIFLDGRECRLEPATGLWGLDTVETMAALSSRHPRPARILAIGPAGEKKSLISAIMTEGGRAAGRMGLGAVMGAKKLKAIVASGDRHVPLASREGWEHWRKETLRRFKQELSPVGAGLAVLGTAGITANAIRVGDAPVKNWAGQGTADFSAPERLAGELLVRYRKRKYHCSSCPLGCGGILRLEDGLETEQPEYETLVSLGSLCLNSDLEELIRLNDYCNRMGLDTISAGGAVAFALECLERGLVGQADLPPGLCWGDAKGIRALLEDIAERRGFGDLLANGVRVAAERLGGEAGELAMHVAGIEVPMHDPKYAPSRACSYVTDPAVGRHTSGGASYAETGMSSLAPYAELQFPLQRYDNRGKGIAHARWSNFMKAADAAGVCLFGLLAVKYPLVELLNAVTGLELDVQELLTVGQRIQTLKQLYNIREGFLPWQVSLPGRVVGNPPPEGGPLAGVTVDVKDLSRQYWVSMGWDGQGRPTGATVASLGLEAIMEGRMEGIGV